MAKSKHLTLMFSTTGSLAAYQKSGQYPAFLYRLQIYAQQFDGVNVCTFDTENYTERWQLANVIHHPMPKIPATSQAYHIISPLLHWRKLKNTTVIRTFNITGAIPGLILRAFTGAPIFVSYGYSLPDFIRFESGWLKYQIYRLVEWIALRFSNRIICATPAQQLQLGRRYGNDKIVYLPNYVDTQQFRPLLKREQRDNYVLFVGRLTPQKNLSTLLYALHLAAKQGFELPLKVVGQGEELKALRLLATELSLDVEFVGVVPNDQLPGIYKRAWAYILPSLFEGMPKTLLEAMACGVPCLGTNVEGINGILVNDVTGIVVSPTSEGLKDGLLRLWYSSDIQRNELGQAARRFVAEQFSLTSILNKEIALLREASR